MNKQQFIKATAKNLKVSEEIVAQAIENMKKNNMPFNSAAQLMLEIDLIQNSAEQKKNNRKFFGMF